MSKELTLALDTCREAGKVAMYHFKQGIKATTKSDGSPVTEADKKCEHLIRAALTKHYPADDILGEEEGETLGTGSIIEKYKRRRWILDPIDGTFGFTRGIPFFATLLALEEDGEIRLGVVSAPAMEEIYWAEKGCGAFLNGKRIYVSNCVDISQSQFTFGELKRILKLGYWQGFTNIINQTNRHRGFGDYLGFSHVFNGRAEAHLEVGVQAWDLAPMKVIVEEAGGVYSDLQGGQSIYTGNCLISNGHLHGQFTDILLDDMSEKNHI